MKNSYILLAAGAAMALCTCCFAGIIGISMAGGLGLTQPVADTGDKFMQALQVGDYSQAFSLCHPSLQQRLGTALALKSMVEKGKAQPMSWSFTSRRMDNNTGRMEGTVTMHGGEGTVLLELTQVGGEWKVLSFDLKQK